MASVILVHGGAGNPRGGVDDEGAYSAALEEAVRAGMQHLEGSAIDAVEAAVRSLEDCALFNAGRGSVLTSAGHVEMDAAIMDGSSLSAGACAAVTEARHPITVARRIMDSTAHVLLVGAPAQQHADELEDPDWFVTDRERARHDEHGTVGAVAVDANGNLAAATSTGGVRGQLPGRVGDSPQIGCGTYADDLVAVSCTGAGEAIIRAVAAHEVAARVRHAGRSLGKAAREVVASIDGPAGLIAAGRDGSLAMPFNTELMYRAWSEGDQVRTAIWGDDAR